MRTINFYLTACILCLSGLCFAQVPQAFSFQSLVTDADGNPIKDSEIAVRIELMSNSLQGEVIYSETHRPSTNMAGIYTIEIGRGNAEMNQFENINWLNSNLFIALYHDIDGGSNYTLVGSSQLLSVPYAFAAGVANVQPQIYVSRIPGTGLGLYTEDSSFAISLSKKYIYKWIQGTPETVLIEYNLPPNTYLRSNSVSTNTGNLSLPNPIENYSGVDTIVDGQFTKNTFIVSDENYQANSLAIGIYPLQAIFKTLDGDTLDILDLPIRISSKNSVIAECAEPYIGTFEMNTTTCDFMANDLSSTAIDVTTEGSLVYNNVLNTNIFVDYTYYDLSTCYKRLNDEKTFEIMEYLNSKYNLEIFHFDISHLSEKSDTIEINLEYYAEPFDTNSNCTTIYVRD